MEGARGRLVDPVCGSATTRRLWLNLPVFLVVVDCLLLLSPMNRDPRMAITFIHSRASC